MPDSRRFFAKRAGRRGAGAPRTAAAGRSPSHGHPHAPVHGIAGAIAATLLALALAPSGAEAQALVQSVTQEIAQATTQSPAPGAAPAAPQPALTPPPPGSTATPAAPGAAAPVKGAEAAQPAAAMPEKPAQAPAPPDTVAPASLSPPAPAPERQEGPPTRVRVQILNASGRADSAQRVTLLLDQYRRREIERTLGLKLELANTSSTAPQARSVVYYRPGFLRAALLMAKVIPGDQTVEPMKPNSLLKVGIDVEIWLGKDTP
ncbi:MAG: LytR C-terminal domain-containing protein [Candidatus Lambdaproteobacteria bacterium]|nr:LytR C-terminal domain-containing protein [Candidatus Lambdaproteobacteria bacterium]